MKRPIEKDDSFDDDFEAALVQWREKHRLREDDAVLLLVDLSRSTDQSEPASPFVPRCPAPSG